MSHFRALQVFAFGSQAFAKSTFNRLLRSAAALVLVATVAGCGGSVEVGIGDDDPPVAGLTLVLTRVGPEAIEIAWSDDPYVASYTVRRDGYPLASVTSTALIDASVLIDETYCYHVSGYDRHGFVIAESATACVTILP